MVMAHPVIHKLLFISQLKYLCIRCMRSVYTNVHGVNASYRPIPWLQKDLNAPLPAC